MPGHELIGDEELAQITDIFKSSQGVLFAHGYDAKRQGRYRVREFEKKVANKVGTSNCLAVSSGTAAIQVALYTLGVRPGDEVITQSFTFVASVEAIHALGAIPVVVDIDHTLNMCPKALEKAITSKTKCIMPVHMMGAQARMDEIMGIGRRRGIAVLEDACQGFGGSYKGASLGTIADIGVVSLDFNKTITTGEGGLLFTSDPAFKKIMTEYHDHGHENQPHLPRGLDTASIGGFNFRMTELQAAVGLAQLDKLDFIVTSNRRNKTLFKEILASLGDRIEFREILSPSEELADAVMFFLPDAKTAHLVVHDLASKKIGTKNVPDAMNWHFAANWKHLWKNHPIYKDTYAMQWNHSFDLLNRCVAFPINVLTSEKDITQTASTIVQSVKQFL